MLVALTTDTHYGFNGTSHNHHYKLVKRLREDMIRRGCKVLLHTGDWATFRQRQLRRTLQLFRELLGPDVKIVCVLGNHDYWYDSSEESYMLEDLFPLHAEWFKEFDITHIQDIGLEVVEDVAFIGYDGWYANPAIHALTNDIKWMPFLSVEQTVDAHAYMQNRSHKSFERMLQVPTDPYRKVVGLTHMPLLEGEYNGNPAWLEFMTEKCDIICFGHSHKRIEAMPVSNECLVYNAGSDYANIRYQFIEV